MRKPCATIPFLERFSIRRTHLLDKKLRSAAAFIRLQLATSPVLRFLLVGGVNTAFGYAMFCIMLVIMPTTFQALVTSSIVTILFNFMTTGSYVFQSRDPRRLVGFFAVYGIVLVYNAVGLALLEEVGLGPRLAAILILPGAVALSYGLNKHFVFRTA